jgi:hypothetical protein
LPGLDEHILDDIFGFGLVLQDAEDEGVEET